MNAVVNLVRVDNPLPFKVHFKPFNQIVTALPGDTVLDVALRAGITVDHVCGGACSCSTCHIVIREGYRYLKEPDDDELVRLEDVGNDRRPTSRLACQTEVVSDLVVEISMT